MRPRFITVFFAATIICAAFTTSFATTQPVGTSITDVTVYPGQARITRTTEVYLDAGVQSVTIDSLPLRAIEESFRASAIGPEGVTLLGLKHRTVQHLESPQKRVAELEKQIRSLDTDRKQSINDRIESFTQQKKFLTSITDGSASQISEQMVKGGLEVSQWGEAYRFIGRGMRETNDSIRVAKQELYEVEQQLKKLRAELATVKVHGAKATRTVQIDLRLPQAGTVKVALDYAITGASWRPLYDARLIDDKHVDLTYLAEVMQETGEDWKDVDLTLSTSTPSEGTGPGDFVAWYLSLLEHQVTDAAKEIVIDRYTTENKFTLAEEPGGDVFIRGGRAGEVRYIVDGTQTMTSAYSVTFKIRRKETVPSGTESVRTTISQWRLDAETKLLCRPRNREAVYRLATVINQDEAPLMPGKVSIFAETDFLGNAWIGEYIAPDETFELPFGADQNLEVKRENLAYKESEKNGILSSKNRVEKTVKITLTNHSTEPKTIEIEESIPVSQNDKIKVKLDDPKPEPQRIDEEGKAIWTMTLAPQGEQVILLPYRVDYPQGERIVGL